MENRGLLFIPDISGFTQFVNQMEIGHSRLIIQELLEVLINANHIGLEISEIEGDAILFYKFGESPTLEQIYGQVKAMFCQFHQNLLAYDNTRFCQCRGCSSAIDLTLKVVTHYGEFAGYQVKDFSKLIGRDIIVAHQLLKNDIGQHEYWLVTDSLSDKAPANQLQTHLHWDSSVKQTESGTIPFRYTQLGRLKDELEPEPLPALSLVNKVKMLSVSQEYNTDMLNLFHATGDFNYRSRWREGVKQVEEINHFLPRIGMRCRCVFDDGQEVIYTSSYSYQPDKIEFSETDEARKSLLHYRLEKKGENKTRCTLDYYLEKNLGRQLLFNLTQKKKLEASLQQSLRNLVALVRELKTLENSAG